jgi:hypothetical protein
MYIRGDEGVNGRDERQNMPQCSFVDRFVDGS